VAPVAGFAMTLACRAVGDLRNCLVALSDEASPLASLFHIDSPPGMSCGPRAGKSDRRSPLSEDREFWYAHSKSREQIMPLRGRAMAATEVGDELYARLFAMAAWWRGETQIAEVPWRYRSRVAEPESPPASSGVLDAIRKRRRGRAFPRQSLFGALCRTFWSDVLGCPQSRPRPVKILCLQSGYAAGETEGYSRATTSVLWRVIWARCNPY